MTLETYLERPDAMNMTALASAIGVSKGRLSQIRKDGKWPAELALKAEAATNGALCAAALCPLIAKVRAA